MLINQSGMQYWLVKEHQRNCEHPWLLPKPDCRVAISKHVKGMLYFLWQLKIVYLLVRMKLFFLSGTACNPNWTYIQSFAPCYITWWPGEGGGMMLLFLDEKKERCMTVFFPCSRRLWPVQVMKHFDFGMCFHPRNLRLLTIRKSLSMIF